MRGSPRQHALDQPAVIGARERDLHLDLRMQPELQHRRGKDHRDVGAHRVHPAPRQRDVAMFVAGHLFELAHRIAQDAPADVLIADAAGQHAGALRAAALRGAARELLQHRIVHVVENLVERFQLVVMRVDVDDRELVVAALARLVRGVLQELGGVEFLDRHLAEVGERDIDHVVLYTGVRTTPATCQARTAARSRLSGSQSWSRRHPSR